MLPMDHTALPYYPFDLTIGEDHQTIAKAAAEHIAERIRAKPDLVLGLATGATMEPVYAELVRMYERHEIEFSQVRFFNLDAYKGLPESDRNSYGHQLHRLLIDRVNANPANVSFVKGIEFDPLAYEAAIKTAGGIDLQLLGLGGEGHLAFNEVGSALGSRTREIALSERTIKDNSMYFSKPGEKTPEHAYTMGLGTILEAKELLVVANNANKALVVQKLIETPRLSSTGSYADQVTGQDNTVESLPARALYAHPKVRVLIDTEAASLLSREDLKKRAGLNDSQADTLRQKFTAEEITFHVGNKSKPLLLSPDFDFYDPKTMGIDEAFDRHNPTHVKALENALTHATDIAVGAHPDDVEIMAGGILLNDQKIGAPTKWLSVIVTNGAASNSVLVGDTSTKTPQERTAMRQHEQREAARLTNTPVIQYKYHSAVTNGFMGAAKKEEATAALETLFAATPNVARIYGHNPLDKHDTHLGVLACMVGALRRTAKDNPHLTNVYGMEVWGGLSGVEPELTLFPITDEVSKAGEETVLEKLGRVIGVYVSQIEGQARDYAKTTIARLIGHGGYVTNPFLSQPPEGMMLGLDMTELVQNQDLTLGQYAKVVLEKAALQKIAQLEEHDIPKAPTPAIQVQR